MADTYTPNLNLTKPEVGASRDTWGGKTNGDWDIVDAIFAAAGSGTSVGLNVGSGKTLTVAGTQNVSGTFKTDTVSEYTAAAGVTVDGVLLKDSGAVLGAGAVGTPSVTTTGDTNTGLYFPAADTLAATTGGTERLRIDSSGNVGIGTASPDAALTVNTVASFGAGAAALPSIAATGDLNTGMWFPAADTIAASTGGTERLRIDSSGTATFTGALVPASSFLRNRIINGDMRIDQRNAGASVTPTSGQYLVDRFFYQATQASKVTAQQNAGSVTLPVGFTKYQGITSSSAYSIGTSDYFLIRQVIEGFNIADLDWGTANAKTVTISFWVRSSLTGTFGGSLTNAGTRWYPFSYTINSANTWEQKTITVVGDTTGTWATDNTAGIQLSWTLGVGSSFSGTAGAWTGSTVIAPTGATSVVGTNGATFYITGVQLEVGTAATPFERRQFGQELALCQRYYQKGSSTLPGFSFCTHWLKVTMRTAPTMTGTAGATLTTITVDKFRSDNSATIADFDFTASAEL